MHVYVFSVHDPDGFWGDIRVESLDQDQAERECRSALFRDHCEGRGSLENPFCLELRSVDGVVAPR